MLRRGLVLGCNPTFKKNNIIKEILIWNKGREVLDLETT